MTVDATLIMKTLSKVLQASNDLSMPVQCLSFILYIGSLSQSTTTGHRMCLRFDDAELPLCTTLWVGHQSLGADSSHK